MIIIISIIVIGIGLFFAIRWSDDNPSESQLTLAQNNYDLDKKVSAWMPWWDQVNAFNSVKNNKSKISSIKPVWYKIRKNASLEKLRGAEDAEIIQYAKDNGIKIIPVITNDCSPQETQTVLSSSQLTDQNIQNILSLVDQYDYDGIEPNYECLQGVKYRQPFSDFITKLASEMHNRNKMLSTAVHAKTSEYGDWGGAAAQDWSVLNQQCDQVKLMTYDYHWMTSGAGDIAPISWMERVVVYATKNIDLNKIYLGIPFYAYDWVGSQAEDLTYNDVTNLINQYKPTIRTSAENEKYFYYTKNSQLHTVYFFDHTTIYRRLQLVNKYQVAGIGIWRIGQEDEDNWSAISDRFGGESTGTVKEAFFNRPLGNAKVLIYQGDNLLAYEDSFASGRYFLNNLAAGTYNLIVHKTRHRNDSQEITVASEGVEDFSDVNFVLTPRYSAIIGKIIDRRTRRPIQGAVVRLYKAGRTIKKTYTNRYGNYVIRDIPTTGTFGMYVNHSRYRIKRRTFSLGWYTRLRRNFSLIR